MVAYGTETMHVLRAEKGYIIVGQDTDGTVTPDDAGLTWAIGKNKPDFVGKRSLERPAMKAADRKQLVGLAHARRRTARGRRAGRGQGGTEAAHGAGRSRDLVLSEQRPQGADRARAHRRRPRPPGSDACTCPCPEETSRSRSHRRFSMTRREKGSMAEAALRRPPPVSAAEWLKTLPPAARWVLHGDAQARARAAPVWGVGFSETACRAVRRAERATLWLGPDEYLLLDLAAQASATDARELAAALERCAARYTACARRREPSAIRARGERAHAEVILRGACPLDLRHKPISGRHVHAHGAGKGRHNVLAHPRGCVPSGGLALVRGLCRRTAARDCAGVPSRVEAPSRFASAELLSSRNTP